MQKETALYFHLSDSHGIRAKTNKMNCNRIKFMTEMGTGELYSQDDYRWSFIKTGGW